MKALMIEDNETDYRLLSWFGAKIDALDVVWRDSLAQGLAYIETNPVDVVMLDLGLPDGYGLESFDRTQARFPDLPIIILSGSDDDQLVLEAVRRGAQDYLVKGQFDSEILRRALYHAVERKRFDYQLAIERNLLRTLIDRIPDYIYVKDSESRFVMVNQAVLDASVLTESEEIVGKTDFDFYPPELAQIFYDDEQAILTSGQALVNKEEMSIDPQTGSRTWFLTTKVPLRDQGANITGLVGISRNITRRKVFEEQRLELRAERERIKVLQHVISDLSHDLRTPLTIINNSLYLLQKANDPQRRQAQVDKMEQQLLRMDRLLNELLQMANLDQPDTTLQFQQTEINAFLKPIIQQYEILAAEKQIALHFEPHTDLCFAHIDAVEFARAIMSLLQNAIAYTSEEGKIIVDTNTQDKYVVIAVQDTGIGIEASDLPHIFEHFYRADQARSTVTGGHGLGLSIALRIIEAHSGTIIVDSTPGKGSTFEIKLPASEAPTTEARRAPLSSAQADL